MIKEGDLDPYKFLLFIKNLIIEERNEYIVNRLISISIYIVKNYIQLKNGRSYAKDELFNIISQKLYGKFPSLKTNMIKYMIETLDTNSINQIKYLFHLLGYDINPNDSMYNNSENNSNTNQNNNNNNNNNNNSHLDIKIICKLLELIYQSDILSMIEKNCYYTFLTHGNKLGLIQDIRIKFSISDKEVIYIF